ncbi:MAG: hypothetical protein DRI69_04875 [Bacteroidetes bacterium]|nr:MAG: hypothetical protein DRI69_04875 [Bacteroidota bacterium]
MLAFAFKPKYIFNLLLVSLLIGVSACVDQEFDAPPPGGTDPDLEANISIAELRAMHSLGQYEEITEDLIIEALVISSDLAGNFFRQLVFQDETAGIEMRVDVTNLDNIYPPGRKIFVKLKNLWLGDFNGLIQLGAAVVEEDGFLELARIPEVLVDDFVFKGTFNNEVVPKETTIDELTANDVSTLVILNDVQFSDVDAGVPYADAINQLSVNRLIVNCDKDEVLIRTSGFSAFAANLTPEGNGSITAVLGIFGSDLQLLMRNLDDVDMEGERCQIGGGNDITIQELRDLFAGGQGTAPEAAIQGVVISDASTGNHVSSNLFIQDETAGIVVRFTSAHEYDLGDEIKIDVTGQELSEFSGLLQVNNVPSGNAVWVKDGTLPTPREATVTEVLQNAEAWESTRVLLKDVTLSGQTSFSGSVTVTDASGAMVMFTRSQADFASSPLPEDAVDMIAIVSEFNTPQLVINSLDDIDGEIGGGDNDIDESFDSFDDNEDIVIAGWTNIAVKGSRTWRCKVFDNRHYAQATAFNDTETEVESWLVTSEIVLNVPKVISFESAMAFWTHDGFSVLISEDFSGDVTTATWVDLGAVLADGNDDDHDWIASGEIDLSAFSSSVHVAFKYVGSGPGGDTGSFRVDDILVKPK